MPFDVNHLWPLMTHSSPSRTASVVIERGSEPAWSGSVIEKPDSISPAMKGRSHFRFCSSVPYLTRMLALPEFGAAMPKSALAPYGVGEDLVHVGERQEVEPGAAVLHGQVRRPQARLEDLGLDLPRVSSKLARRLDSRASSVRLGPSPRTPEHLFVGQDLVVDQIGRAAAKVVDRRAQPVDGRHVDGHGLSWDAGRSLPSRGRAVEEAWSISRGR